MKKLNLLFSLLISLFTYQMYQGQSFSLATCSSGLSSNVYGPMNSTTTANNKNRTAVIIPASQLAPIANGTITSTYFKRLTSSGSLNATTTFKIYLKNTSATDFGAAAIDWATQISDATLVYDSNPATAVGSTAGYKQFLHSTNFVYTAGSNLAIYMEYTQTTGQSSTIAWDYEYGSGCINTANDNTTKYVNTTSAFGATLTNSNYRRPIIGFDATVPPATTPPLCTTVSTPANAATGISVTPTISWGTAALATSYSINMGTTPGGTDILNNVDVGTATSYSIPAATPLSYSTQYYVKIIPKNNIGSATGCAESTFTTTTIPCPSVSAPSNNATGISLTPTITWTAAPQATGYKLRVGTAAGGSNILNNVDIGNVTSYTFTTPLNPSTKYYYSVSSYNATSNSTTCSERNFTTQCGAVPAPFAETFSGGVLPGCWANSSTNNTSNALWKFSGTTDYGTTNNGNQAGKFAWVDASSPYAGVHDVTLTTPEINLTGLTVPYVEFKWFKNHLSSATGTTQPPYDNNSLTVQVKETGASTWATIFTSSTNSSIWRTEGIALASSYVGKTIQVRFVVDKDVAGNGYFYDDLLLDDVEVKEAPSCISPSNLTISNITPFSATVAWTAPPTAPGQGYDVYIDTVNNPPLPLTSPTVTGLMANSYNLPNLTPNTTYYVWVRSRCSASEQSAWVGSVTITTQTFCPTVTAPANATIGLSLTPTITWNAVSGATGYKLSVGTAAGGVDVLNNVDLGNATSYTFTTPLSYNTKYYYTVNAYNATATSSSCTERNFTTVCAAVVPAYTNDFSTFPGGCWTQLSGGSATTPPTGTTSFWVEDGFLNNGTTGAARINLYDQNRAGWLKTIPFNLSGGGYRVKFDYGVTTYSGVAASAMGSDDILQFLVSTDDGATWTVLQTWTNANVPSNTTNNYSLDLTITSPNTIFAFYGSDGTVNDTEDYNFYIDNFVVEAAPLATNEVSGTKNNIKVYPNPFADVLNISGNIDVKTAYINDVAGRLVKTIENPGTVLHLGELKSGLYLVTLELKDGSKQTIKAIKR